MEGSTKKSVEVLVMRHAESVFNKVHEEWAAANNQPREHMGKDIRFASEPKEIIDALLTDQGIDQCKKANQEILGKYKNIKYVLVSPLRRTVATALEAMKDFPTDTEWRVLPWLREALTSNCDVAVHSIEYLKEHPHIKHDELEGDNLWFLKYYHECPDAQHQAKLLKRYEESPAVETILDYMSEAYPNMERPFQLDFRANKVREAVRKFIEEKTTQGVEVNDNEILLVSHYRLIKHLYGAFDESGTLIPGMEWACLNNAEIKPYSLEL